MAFDLIAGNRSARFLFMSQTRQHKLRQGNRIMGSLARLLGNSSGDFF